MTGPLVHADVTVLEVGDPALLDHIRALIDLDAFVVARISETALVVDPARTGELADLLEQHQLIPLVRRAR